MPPCPGDPVGILFRKPLDLRLAHVPGAFSIRPADRKRWAKNCPPFRRVLARDF